MILLTKQLICIHIQSSQQSFSPLLSLSYLHVRQHVIGK